MSSIDAAPDGYGRALSRGALFNLLGVVARLGHPLFLLTVTWLWGSAFMGLYLLAQAMLEVASSAVIDAPADATVVFASRNAETAHQYRVIATAIRVALGLAIAIALVTLVAGAPLITRFFPGYRELVPGIFLLAFALVPRALSQTTIAATKAMLHMEHDALLNGLLQPLLLLGGGAAAFALGGGLTGLLAAQLAAEVVLCVFALGAFRRYFSLRALGAALIAPAWDRKLAAFVLPQGLNLTFNRYIARLDGIMLAAFGLGKSELGYYGTAALLTHSLTQIRMIFSSALAPVVARLHSGGRRAEFEESLSRVARWTTSLVIPAIFLLLVYRADLLALASPNYDRDSLFVVVLMIPLFTNCAYGLAGACLMFTGWSRITLANSVGGAALTTALTWFLIPRHGMLGAAIATAIVTSIMTGLQMVELWHLEKVAIRWRAVWMPHLAFAAGLLPIAAAWDPATASHPTKLLVALLSCGISGTLLWLLGRQSSASPCTGPLPGVSKGTSEPVAEWASGR